MKEPSQIARKYFRNQKKPTDLDFQRYSKKKENYKDPYFWPDERSLYSQDIKYNYIDTKHGEEKKQLLLSRLKAAGNYMITWKRASEICPLEKLEKLYTSNTSFKETKQGNLGDCYLISTIAMISQYPNLVRQILKITKYNPLGYYELVLFIDGEWQIVILDDYFPYNSVNDTYLFARSEANLLWVMLLEKAWAKIHGGYSNIIGSYEHVNHFSTLTGFPSEYIWNQEEKNGKKQSIEIFEMIEKNLKGNFLITANTFDDPRIDKVKLASNHSYSIVDCKKVNNLRVLKLFNPWGFNEYKGEFESFDENDAKKYKAYNERKNDGTCWIDIYHFVEYFDTTNFCDLIFDGVSQNYYLNRKLLAFPLVFNLIVKEDNKFIFGVFYQRLKYLFFENNKLPPTFLIIAKYDSENQLEEVYSKSTISGDLYKNINLKKGNYVIWLYIPIDKDKISSRNKICFSVLSNDDYKIILVRQDNDYAYIHSLAFRYIEKVHKNEMKDKEFYTEISMNNFDGIFVGVLYNSSLSKLIEIIDLKLEILENCELILPEKPNEINIKSFFLYPRKFRTVIAIRTGQERCYFKYSTAFKAKTLSFSVINNNVIEDNSQFFQFNRIDHYKEKERENNIVVVCYKTVKERKIPVDLSTDTIRSTLINTFSTRSINSGSFNPININLGDITKEDIKRIIDKLNYVNKIDPEKLQMLKDMGFNQRLSEYALNLYGNNHALAIDYLLSSTCKYEEEEIKPIVKYEFTRSVMILDPIWICKFDKSRNRNNKCKICGESKKNAEFFNGKNIINGRYVSDYLAVVHKISFAYIYDIEKGQWACTYCTFLNVGNSKTCSMCWNLRERSIIDFSN